MLHPDLHPDYEFSADLARLERARVHALLTEHAYWADGRTRETQDRAIAGSRNYGVLVRATGELVAYSRLVTDDVTFAWLADVVVDPAHRGKGVGTALVAGAVADVEPLGLKRIALKASDDARGIYERLGFGTLDVQAGWLERRPTHTCHDGK